MAVNDNLVETEVLVVGGGLAGCWAALRARDFTPEVTLVDKAVVARSGITLYCHDMIAPMPKAEAEAWLNDVVVHADYLSDQAYAETLLREQGDRVNDLVRFGVPFERDESGNLFLGLGRGHVASRVILYDGRKLMEVMRKEVLKREIKLVERLMVSDLLTSDGAHPTRGRVVGALGLHTRTGELVTFKAKAVVLTSSIMTAKLHLGYNDNLTGDGQAMALNAGAELSNLEFLFNPNYTSPYKGGVAGSAGLIQFQTLGAYLVNARGERFMDKYAGELKERRSNFGLLAQALAKEILEGRGPVYFDMRHFDEKKFQQARRIIPITMSSLDDAGIDPSKELVPCRPIVGYFGASGSGGVRIDINGETSLPGLLAAGACAQCPGYAIPLSGGFTAFCNVSGFRAGQQAAKIALEAPEVTISKEQIGQLQERLLLPLKKKDGVRPGQVYERLNKNLVKIPYGLFKTEATIKEMLEEIGRVKRDLLPHLSAGDIHELVKAKEADNFVSMLEAIYLSALTRKESRLTHYRSDYPYRDDLDWLKWIVVGKKGQEINMRFEPVPLEGCRIPLPRREKVPSTIQLTKGPPS